MRRIVLSVAVVLAVAAAVSAQSTTVRVNQIMISHGTPNFIMNITQDAFYLGEPALSIPAAALPGATLRVSRFSVRGWHEGDHSRVVIYAVVPDPQASSKTIETPIATYPLKFGSYGTVRMTETAEWGAAPMVLRAVRPLR
jgi:hypothetical protein